jgi:hypothetical protein
MSDRDIVTPLGVTQDPLLHAPCALSKKSLGGVGQNAEYDLVKDLFLLRKIAIGIIRIVVVLLVSSAA